MKDEQLEEKIKLIEKDLNDSLNFLLVLNLRLDIIVGGFDGGSSELSTDYKKGVFLGTTHRMFAQFLSDYIQVVNDTKSLFDLIKKK